MNKKRVFIVHGWEATPDIHWFPWLKRELETRGFFAEALAMPHTSNPQMEEWVWHLHEKVGTPDEHTYFVGHSLGGIAILRYAEALGGGVKIGGAVLVAGFSEPIEFDELSSFFRTPLDYEKVKNSITNIVSIHSPDDQVVPFKYAEILQERLGAELLVIGNAGHFNAGDGFTELPAALEAVLKMAHT